MFRSSGPRSRRPPTAEAPTAHSVTRREVALLRSVQLLLAPVKGDQLGSMIPLPADRRLLGSPATGRLRAALSEYLRLQGGEVRDPRGFVTRHLRVALGAGPDLRRLLRAMEAAGEIERDVRGRRTYAVRLAGEVAPSGGAAPDHPTGAGDFAAFAAAVLTMLDKRLAVADLDDRFRIERILRERAAVRRDLEEWHTFVRGPDAADAAAVRAYCDGKLEAIADRAIDFERRTGVTMDLAFTADELDTLRRLLGAPSTLPA